MTPNNTPFHAEAASAASVQPYRHSLDGMRRAGSVSALAGRCAR